MFSILWMALPLICPGLGQAQQATLSVHGDQIQHHLSPSLTGACIEDVNHESAHNVLRFTFPAGSFTVIRFKSPPDRYKTLSS